MPLERALRETIDRHALLAAGDVVVLGVSGGADSLVRVGGAWFSVARSLQPTNVATTSIRTAMRVGHLTFLTCLLIDPCLPA